MNVFQTTGRTSLRRILVVLSFAALLGIGLSIPAEADRESISDAHQTRRIESLERQLGRMKHNAQHRRIRARLADDRLSNRVDGLKRQVYGELDYRTDVLICMIETLEAEIRGASQVPCTEIANP